MKNKTFFRIYISIGAVFIIAIIIGTLLFIKLINDSIKTEKNDILDELETVDTAINSSLDKLSQSAFLISKSDSLISYEVNSSRYSEQAAYQQLLTESFDDLLQIESFSSKLSNELEVYFPKIDLSLGTSAPFPGIKNQKVLLFRHWLYEKDQNRTMLSYYTNNLNSKEIESIGKTSYIVRVTVEPIQLLSQNMRSQNGFGIIADGVPYTYNLFNDQKKLFYEKSSSFSTIPFASVIIRNNKLQLLATYPNEKARIKMVMIRDISGILPTILGTVVFYIGTLFIVGLFIFYILFVIRRKIHQPLKEVTAGLKEFQTGNYSYRIESQSENEYKYIVSNFNLLGQKILSLINNIVDEQDRTKNAELKQLQLQMNPHFLYNSLSFIASAAKLEMKDEVVAMCYSLSDYYRYVLSSSSKETTLRMELDAIATYLEIFRMRSLRLEYTFDIPKELMDQRFPSMLLQPIIENSIKYGLETSEQDLQITLSGTITNNKIQLIFKDNGKQLSQEDITYLNDVILTGNSGEHTGLMNIKRRMKYNFGEEASLIAFMNLPRGLIIEMTFPTVTAPNSAFVKTTFRNSN